MGTRPLRQYYDGVSVEVDDDLALVEPWLRHRRRFATSLASLSDSQWKAETRCLGWDARAVVSHLVTVDGFWTMTMGAAYARSEPTSFIRGFDPSTGTNDMVAVMLEQPTDVILERFVAGTDTFVALVDSYADDDWDALGEAPFGHMPARLLLGHAFWDSWLHERDILQPLGLAPAIETDEVLASTWYALVVGGLQGGLIGDAAPAGPGAEQPIDVTLRFDDLPRDPLQVRIDSGVRVTRADGTNAVAAGSAVDLVEGLAGRVPLDALAGLPADLADQLARAGQIL